MNKGDYIRNKYGIAKILDIKTNEYGIDICYLDNDIAFVLDNKTKEEKCRTNILPLTDNIDINKLKHSPNIIDLIEVGDVILYKDNSIVKILEIDNKLNPPYYLMKDYCDEFWETQEWVFDGIKSVITHEQIEQTEYKL